MITLSKTLKLLKYENLYGLYFKDQYNIWCWRSMKELRDKYDFKKIMVTHIETYFSISDGSFNGFKIHTTKILER